MLVDDLLSQVLLTNEVDVPIRLYTMWKYARQNYLAYVVPYLQQIMKEQGDILMADDLFIIEFEHTQ